MIEAAKKKKKKDMHLLLDMFIGIKNDEEGLVDDMLISITL